MLEAGIRSAHSKLTTLPEYSSRLVRKYVVGYDGLLKMIVDELWRQPPVVDDSTLDGYASACLQALSDWDGDLQLR